MVKGLWTSAGESAIFCRNSAPQSNQSANFTPCVDHILNLKTRFAEMFFLNSCISTNSSSHPFHNPTKRQITIPSASPSAQYSLLLQITKYPKLGVWKCCIETWCIARLQQLPLPLPPSESMTTYLGSRYGKDALNHP